MNSILEIWWQILLAAVAYFSLGAIWFNPKVFGTTWANAHGLEMDPEKRKEVNMVQLMGTAFLFTVMISTVIAKLCMMSCGVGEACHAMGIMHCIKIGLMVGGIGALAIWMTYMYLMKPINAFLTDGLYHIIGSILASCVLYWLGAC